MASRLQRIAMLFKAADISLHIEACREIAERMWGFGFIRALDSH